MQNVSIIGLGLIGASIGLGLKKWSSQQGKRESVLEITGFDVGIEAQNYSKRIKAVDRTEWNMTSAISRADVIVIATPIGEVREIFEIIADHGKQGVIVTDTCSTKFTVMQQAKEILPSHVSFVGGHPMAGGTLSTEGADANLFDGATWCVSPLVNAGEEAVQTVLGMISAVGAEPIFIDPQEHDGYVAGISHMPFLLSVALMRAVSKDPSWRDMQTLTAGGFRDVSRLASGSPAMHRDICLTNRDNILRWTDAAIDELQNLRDLVAGSDDTSSDALEANLAEARDARAAWATTEREGRLVQDTENELAPSSVGEQMQQMFFGSLFRRRPRTGRDDRDRGENGSGSDRR